MFEYLKYAFQMVSDAVKEHQSVDLFHQQVFYKRVAIPVFMDLSKLEVSKDPLHNLDYRFIELKREDIEAGKWPFLVDNRRFAALRHIKQGQRGFALVNIDNVVVGDIWCLTPNNTRAPIEHPDLDMLKITCSGEDVYALDMFIPKNYRGKNLAVPIHRSFELTMKHEGWRNLYAYYWQDNIPSRWMHLMLKFSELPKFQVSRFFFIRIIHQPVGPASVLVSHH
jgi:hypothetical protein